MRTIKFTMDAEIDIEDKEFDESMFDVDKVWFDVVRGYNKLRVKDIVIHKKADPIIHVCLKKEYEK